MKPIEELPVEGHLRVLIFGPPGNGKTALAATFPKPVFIDTDRGLKTLRSRWFQEWSGGADDILYETFDDEYDPSTGLFKKATAVWDIQRFINEQIMAPDSDRETIVPDSLTTLQALAMHVGLELSGNAGRSKTLFRAKSGKGHPVALPTQADFGAEMSVFEQLMDGLCSLPRNVVCIAHERESTNDRGALLKREPALIGTSIRGKIARWFDEVWYLDVVGKGNRVLITQPTNILKVVKTRSGVPDGLPDPTYTRIMEALNEPVTA